MEEKVNVKCECEDMDGEKLVGEEVKKCVGGQSVSEWVEKCV